MLDFLNNEKLWHFLFNAAYFDVIFFIKVTQILVFDYFNADRFDYFKPNLA